MKVIIFGGTGSIGLATAELLSSQSALVAITGRTPEKLACAEKRVRGLQAYRCEITNETEVEEVLSAFGGVDHIVVLAGSACGGGRVVETPSAEQRLVIDERLLGPIHVVRAAVRSMQHGSITLASGLFAGRPPESGAAILVAALSGVEGLARALARELAPIRVNAVSFGVIRSARHSFMGAGQEGHYRRVGSSLPTARVGEPREAAQAILFAITNEYLTGEVLHVDGGARLV